MATQNYHTFVWWWWWWWSQVCAKLLFVKTRDKTKHVYAIVSDKKQSKLHTRRGGGGRRGQGPRNDVLTTCTAVTPRGGQRKIAVLFPH